MYPLDFEEFLWANGVAPAFVDSLRQAWHDRTTLPQSIHDKMMAFFRTYLLTGGMPDVVNTYITTHNIIETRQIQTDIHDLYGDDAAKYEDDTFQHGEPQKAHCGQGYRRQAG